MNTQSKMLLMMWLPLLGTGVSSAASQDREYCAFEVVVTTPRGLPVIGAPVAEDYQGRPFATAMTDKSGVARLCDAPADSVDIVVGGKRCGATRVSYLSPYWMRTRRVSVTYENCSGEEWMLPGGCRLTIRLRDERTSAPLPGARFRGGDSRAASEFETYESDTFGRVFRFIRYGTTLSGTLDKDGYAQGEVSEPCTRGENPYLEKIIALHELGR